MNLPAGLIFYLDFQYGSGGQNFKGANESLYGATDDLKRTTGSFDRGLYGAGEFGYSISQSVSSNLTFEAGTATATVSTTKYQTGSATLAGILNADFDFSASFAGKFNQTNGVLAGGGKSEIKTVAVLAADLDNADLEAVRAFKVNVSGPGVITGSFPQFTRVNNSNVEFVVQSSEDTAHGNVTISYLKGPDNLDNRGDFEDSIPAAATSTQVIPEINVQLRSETVAAKTRKLKAQWTPEFAQDLNAYHSIDAEAELTSILSEYISMEIDLEILDMLIKNADTIEGWSAKVAKNITLSTNNTEGGTTAATISSNTDTTNVYYTKMSWFQTLGIKLQKVSNLIHQKTLRGGANWMVCGPKISTVLESIPGFAADSAGDEDKYNMGVQKVGAINNRYTVYKNPYMTENIILMGYKGSQFLETAAVFVPYIPLIMTPLVYDPVSFTPRKGIMTRYAKKMVRPDFYGKVIISDLNEV